MNIDFVKGYLERFEVLLKQGINPQAFDPKIFVSDLQTIVSPVIAEAVGFDKQAILDFRTSMQRVAEQIRDTLVAIQLETDAVAREALQKDLAISTPSQLASIKSTLISKLATSGEAILEAVWNFIVRTAVAAAKALILGAITA